MYTHALHPDEATAPVLSLDCASPSLSLSLELKLKQLRVIAYLSSLVVSSSLALASSFSF